MPQIYPEARTVAEMVATGVLRKAGPITGANPDYTRRREYLRNRFPNAGPQSIAALEARIDQALISGGMLKEERTVGQIFGTPRDSSVGGRGVFAVDVIAEYTADFRTSGGDTFSDTKRMPITFYVSGDADLQTLHNQLSQRIIETAKYEHRYPIVEDSIMVNHDMFMIMSISGG